MHNCLRHVVSIAAIEGSRVHSGTGPNSVSFHRRPSWLGGAISTASCCSGCEGDERARWSKELGAVQQRIGLAKSCGWGRPAQPRASARAKRPTMVPMRGVQTRRRLSAPGFDATEKGTMTVILHHRINLGGYVNGGELNRPEDAPWHSLAVGSRCLLTSRVLVWCCGLSLAKGPAPKSHNRAWHQPPVGRPVAPRDVGKPTAVAMAQHLCRADSAADSAVVPCKYRALSAILQHPSSPSSGSRTEREISCAQIRLRLRN
ncbi:hypothetical protein VTI28DRAFT_8445 [Corynascus sepedonium]